MDLLKGVKEYVYPVGRLDYDSEGLLLLTNDGELAARLTHPSHEIEKVYEARVRGVPAAEDLERLAKGIVIDGQRTSPAKIRVADRPTKTTESGAEHTFVEVILHEGRQRQVRRMFESIGHPVGRLRRDAHRADRRREHPDRPLAGAGCAGTHQTAPGRRKCRQDLRLNLIRRGGVLLNDRDERVGISDAATYLINGQCVGEARASAASEPAERCERRRGERATPSGSPKGEVPRILVTADDALEREFGERLRESSSLAFRVAYGVLRHREDAEDVAQEAFVRAHRSIAQLRDRERFRAWLVRMTWRLAIDRRRTDKRRAIPRDGGGARAGRDRRGPGVGAGARAAAVGGHRRTAGEAAAWPSCSRQSKGTTSRKSDACWISRKAP